MHPPLGVNAPNGYGAKLTVTAGALAQPLVAITGRMDRASWPTFINLTIATSQANFADRQRSSERDKHRKLRWVAGWPF
jgi:hypothetical protein